MSEQIKVAYLVRGGMGATSKAYVDDETLLGTDKYSDVDVQLAWDEEGQAYVQTDLWEWDLDRWGEPSRRAES